MFQNHGRIAPLFITAALLVWGCGGDQGTPGTPRGTPPADPGTPREAPPAEPGPAEPGPVGQDTDAIMEDGGTIQALWVTNTEGVRTTEYSAHHPIVVHIGLGAEEASHDHPVWVGLVQESKAGELIKTHGVPNTCLLGTFDAEYHKKQQGEEGHNEPHFFEKTFIVPESCKPEGGWGSVKYNLWVSLNPAVGGAEEVKTVDPHPENVNTQFFDHAHTDLEPGADRNGQCFTDYEAKKGQYCVLDLKVSDSPGLDVQILEIHSSSDVAMLHTTHPGKCDGNPTHTTRAACEADAIGSCSELAHTTEAECHVNGETWTPTHPWVLDTAQPEECAVDFQKPFLKMGHTLVVYGKANHDGVTDGAMDPPVNALAGEDASTDVSGVAVDYSICPSEDGNNCAPGTDYKLLKIHGHGNTHSCWDGANHTTHETEAECADAGHTWAAIELLDKAVIDQIEPGVSVKFDQTVFLDGTADACKAILGTDTSANAAWSESGEFLVRVCAHSNFDTAAPNSHDDNANNCKTHHVLIPRNQPVATDDNTWSVGCPISRNHYGNNIIGLQADFGACQRVNLSGATSDNQAVLRITGWVTFELLNIYAQAAAPVAITGSYARYLVRAFGTTYYGPYNRSIPQIHAALHYSNSVSARFTYLYGIPHVVNVQASLTGTGTVGINGSLDVQGCAESDGGVCATARRTHSYASGTKVGVIDVNVEPYLNLSVTASGSVQLGPLRGRVTGTVVLADVRVPTRGTLNWGLVAGPGLRLVTRASMELRASFLDGRIVGVGEAYLPHWCSGGGICAFGECTGAPCAYWTSAFSRTFSWSGYAWNHHFIRTCASNTLRCVPVPAIIHQYCGYAGARSLMEQAARQAGGELNWSNCTVCIRHAGSCVNYKEQTLTIR